MPASVIILAHVLFIVLLATMSGCCGYRSIGGFIDRYRATLLAYLELAKDRLPSFLNVRQVMMRLDPMAFHKAFSQWALQDVASTDLIALDGQGVRCTTTNYDNRHQDTISIVSAYCLNR